MATKSLATKRTTRYSLPSTNWISPTGSDSSNGSEIPTAQQRQSPDEIDGPLQIVLEPCAQIDAETIDGRPVIPRSETVTFAREHSATFESALDILDRMYDDLEIEADCCPASMEVPR